MELSMDHTGGTAPQAVDPATFHSFYLANRARAEGYLIHQGATRHDAEDATQQAMWDLHRRWTEIEKPGPWLYRAALGHLRRAAFRRRRERTACAAAYDTREHHDPDDVSEERQRVLALLRQLPYEQRRVMALYMEGLSPTEIADSLNKPAETVRSNLRHARARLTQALQADLVAVPALAGGSHARAGHRL